MMTERDRRLQLADRLRYLRRQAKQPGGRNSVTGGLMRDARTSASIAQGFRRADARNGVWR